jgi:hypothetical protein
MTMSQSSRGSLLEGLVAQDAGVVDQDVDGAELGDGVVDDRFRTLPGRYGSLVRDGRAAGGTDFLDHLVGHVALSRCRRRSRRDRSRPPSRRARANSSACCLADAAAGAGDHDDLVLEFTHGSPPRVVFRAQRPAAALRRRSAEYLEIPGQAAPEYRGSPDAATIAGPLGSTGSGRPPALIDFGSTAKHRGTHDG